MKKMKYSSGFTLVELLIVIALIAILSVAVLATINPIEQSNKARDSRVQNDAAEVMNAYERYYASTQSYPWQAYTTNQLDAEDAVVLRSDTYGFGICKSAAGYVFDATDAAGDCDATQTNQNELISTSELKSSFIGKDEFEPVRDGTKPEQALWAVKAASGDSVYVCYVPKAKANRSQTAKNRCITRAGGVVQRIGEGNCAAAVDADYAVDPDTHIVDAPDTAVFQCVPE